MAKGAIEICFQSKQITRKKLNDTNALPAKIIDESLMTTYDLNIVVHGKTWIVLYTSYLYENMC